MYDRSQCFLCLPMPLTRRLSAIAARLGLILVLMILLPAPAHTAPVDLAQAKTPMSVITPQAAIERLFTTTSIQQDWFDSSFLAQVPLTQVQSIVASLKGELGAYRSVRSQGQSYVVVFERGTVPTKIVLNAAGQIRGLLFQSGFSSLTDAVNAFKALPGDVSLLVIDGQSEQVALNVDRPLAVGSTFKLAVLKALRSQIEAGQRSWRDIVTLESERKSLPSGILQGWPDGTPLTVESLASLMISISDNTATDRLIHLVGREPIEAIAPRNRPFLTTREAFVLKSAKNSKWLQRYRSGDSGQRRSLLPELAKLPLPTINEFESSPPALDVEWFFSVRELCGLIAQVQDLPLMAINSGVASAEDWQRVAFKGGSEPGVINMTTWLEAKNGKRYCVSATWNHATVDNNRFSGLYQGLIGVLK